MRPPRLVLLALAAGVLLAAVAHGGEEVTRRVRSHATFLADDALQGRAAGTPGYDLAAKYVAAQYARIGLAPGAGEHGLLQPVPLREIVVPRETGRLVIRHGEREDALTPLTDVLVSPAPGETEVELTAPAVWVGYGVRALEIGHDDLADVDVRGKIVVLLDSAPDSLPNDARAHYSTSLEKYPLLVQLGAVGVVTVTPPREAVRRPWAMVAALSSLPGLRLLEPDGRILNGFPELRARAALNPAAVARLFAAAPIPAAVAIAAAERNEVRSFPLGVTLTLAATATVRPVESANVLGWLPGSEPALASEPIVVTAHLDHLGIGPAVDGDAIYNGAMDNAIGTAVLLAVAEELAAGPRLRRPVLFAALTAEEKGLLGAFHLAAHPPGAVTRYAANLNLDMPLFLAPVRDVVAWGAEHSTLGAAIQAAAGRTGFTVSPDFMPEENLFVRSDQYAFIRQGVPALMLGTGRHGLEPGVDLAPAWQEFLRTRYHRPNDDLAQPIDWPSAGAYAAFATELVREIARMPEAPTWHPGNFFGEKFAGERR